ncbi:MAG: outer membrane beta-barrel protein [Proteobacteria bacterium]|nr:outer membrane beta-barrel protein [Pseudomonadota bacterium]MBS1920500.1 outer membrane beta-barrel protein [Bacteroidota bacterium]MBS1931101.1 outer membrane beta-barrel protein [Bacteroidota bacterium]
MKYKIVISLFVFFVAGYSAKSQDSKMSINLNYNYSFPLSDFKSNLVGNASPRGFTGNILYHANPILSIGLGFGYQDYFQKYPRQVYNYGQSQQISAVLSNSVQTIPVMARVEFSPFLKTLTSVRPYVSAAAGANFISNTQYLGEFSNPSNSTGFIAQGGFGIKIPFMKFNNWGADIGGTYNYAPYKKFGYKNLDNVNVHAGIYFNLSE